MFTNSKELKETANAPVVCIAEVCAISELSESIWSALNNRSIYYMDVDMDITKEPVSIYDYLPCDVSVVYGNANTTYEGATKINGNRTIMSFLSENDLLEYGKRYIANIYPKCGKCIISLDSMPVSSGMTNHRSRVMQPMNNRIIQTIQCSQTEETF